MTLRDLAAKDVQDVVLNDQDFAEQVTYKPKAGGSVTINALPMRGEPDAREESGSHRYRGSMLRIANHATLGVVTPKLGDKIDMVQRVGGGTVEARVAAIVSTTEASHVLEVTA